MMNKPTLPLEKCTACGACVSKCPHNALNLVEDADGFYSPVVNEELCVGCKLCEKLCHVLNLQTVDRVEIEKYGIPYMIKAKDKDIVAQSSSGGIFSLLSDVVLKKGGCVYGARYNYASETLECSSTDECSIEELRKSKYIESYMGSTFRSIYEKLKEGRQVLYCGTPCQVRGLRHYLSLCKCPLDNLLAVRFICHGVPSNKFFKEYKHYIERKYKSKAVHIDFRPKDFGWRLQSLHVDFENGKMLAEPPNCNPYFTSFMNNDVLRLSCYHCDLLNECSADLTIADFWGIHFYKPENKDQEGISLVISHNERGADFINQISNKCDIEKLPYSAIEYIFGRHSYENKLNDRSTLMKKIREKGYIPVALDLYAKACLKNKIRMTISKIVRNFIGKN